MTREVYLVRLPLNFVAIYGQKPIPLKSGKYGKAFRLHVFCAEMVRDLGIQSFPKNHPIRVRLDLEESHP